MISLGTEDKDELYIIDDLFFIAFNSIFCFGWAFLFGIISVSQFGTFLSLKKFTHLVEIVYLFVGLRRYIVAIECSINVFLSIPYLANCFWYLTHSSSNVIWLKLKFSILLLIISVLGVLGSVPDCSETIFCMMSFNLVGRIVLRNWKTIDFYWF